LVFIWMLIHYVEVDFLVGLYMDVNPLRGSGLFV